MSIWCSKAHVILSWSNLDQHIFKFDHLHPSERSNSQPFLSTTVYFLRSCCFEYVTIEQDIRKFVLVGKWWSNSGHNASWWPCPFLEGIGKDFFTGVVGACFLSVLFWKILVRFQSKATGSITCLPVNSSMYFPAADYGGRELHVGSIFNSCVLFALIDDRYQTASVKTS